MLVGACVAAGAKVEVGRAAWVRPNSVNTPAMAVFWMFLALAGGAVGPRLQAASRAREKRPNNGMLDFRRISVTRRIWRASGIEAIEIIRPPFPGKRRTISQSMAFSFYHCPRLRIAYIRVQ